MNQGFYMSNILHLTLKKNWFDMIASSKKPEEYRKIKEHWELEKFAGRCDKCGPEVFDDYEEQI